jgi:hypothetical protein
MNFRTESLDFPQNEQRRCLSCDMTNHSTGDAGAHEADIQRICPTGEGRPERSVPLRIKGPTAVKQETTQIREGFRESGPIDHFVTA